YLSTATTVTPTVTDPAATVSVNGVAVTSGSASAPILLAVGENTLTVIVTAEDGVTTSTYTVTVTRESPSAVATLADLDLSAGALDQVFKSGQFVYSATVGYLSMATTVTPTATDPAATVSVNGVAVTSGSASVPILLAVGENTLTVIVTAEDGVTTSTYTVTVTRESPSAVATLADLDLSAGALDQMFQSDQFVYTATAGFLTMATTVTPTATVPVATVSVNGVDVGSGSASAPILLAVGENTLTVMVTAEDGVTTSTYTVTVTRESASEFAQQAYIKASNTGDADQFGNSVALSGDTLAVGAYREDSNATGIDGDENDNSMVDSGAVYVFIRNGTVWSQQAYIKASNTGSGDRFGYSLALSGDTLAVGAYREESNATGIDADKSDNSLTEAGAVYVFTRSGAVWSQQAYIKASNTGSGDAFGWSVALSGDTLAVGATGEASDGSSQTNNSLSNAGAAYVFTRSGTMWTQQAYFKASNPDSDDSFGYSVALSGDTLAVGADREASNATGVDGDQDDNTLVNAGAVYMFTRSGAAWTQQAYIKASNTGSNDVFGWSLALFGETLAVGAAGEASSASGINGNQNDDSAPFTGAVYVFTRSGTAWSQQAYIKASNAGEADQFGWGLALTGDILAVGAPREDSSATGVGGDPGNDGLTDSGAVYLFTRSGTVWSQQDYIKAAVTDKGDFFGYSVALSGDTLAAGAPGEDSKASGVDGDALDNSQSGSGAAYVFQ
ncbi:MAG: cadherin-like beta sandwich domain-containing protein, partial [Gammaproteobacteria bacterium]